MNFGEFISDMAKDAETTFGRIRDKGTFTRVVYAAYLISRSDGTVSSDEKKAIGAMIQRNLPTFKIKDITSAIDKADDIVSFDETTGKLELLNEIEKANGDAKDLIMRTAIYVANADGNFDASEKAAARTICQRLSLDLTTYGIA